MVTSPSRVECASHAGRGSTHQRVADFHACIANPNERLRAPWS